jgi:hypothetical protein
VNCGGTAEFAVVVESGKDIASAGIGKNSQMSDFGKLLSDGMGATDGQNWARPVGGDPLRASNRGAYSRKGARANPYEDLIGKSGERKIFL